MPIVEVTPTGATAMSLEEARADQAARFASIFGGDLALAAQTPQGQLAGLNAVLAVELGEAFVDLASAFSKATAVGVWLDWQGSWLGIQRRQATSTRVTATLTGTAGTNVPAGSRVRNTDGDEFQSLASAQLAPAGVSVDFEAVEEGSVPAAASTLTQIVSVVAGWETVTNPTAGTTGRDRQPDPEYRIALGLRSAHAALGPVGAMVAGLYDAGGDRVVVKENRTAAAILVQEWPIVAGGVLAVVEGGEAEDLTRSMETHRALGGATMAGIVGGTPGTAALDAVADGTVTWKGTDYTGLDLSGGTTSTEKAAALTTLLANSGVTVTAIDGIYVAAFVWMPGESPAFTGTVAGNFGLTDTATQPEGPFVRARARALAVSATVTRQRGFPSDGMNQIRVAMIDRVKAYDLGEQLWANDLLAVAEGVGGTRLSAFSATFGSVDADAADVPLDGVWTLDAASISLTIV